MNATERTPQMTELADYQTRLARASEVRPGDFLDRIDPNTTLRGPRGGRYRYDGQKVESRVERVCWLVGGEEIDAKDEWRPLHNGGFRIYTRQGRVTLPGNLADLTSAVVRR